MERKYVRVTDLLEYIEKRPFKCIKKSDVYTIPTISIDLDRDHVAKWIEHGDGRLSCSHCMELSEQFKRYYKPTKFCPDCGYMCK